MLVEITNRLFSVSAGPKLAVIDPVRGFVTSSTTLRRFDTAVFIAVSGMAVNPADHRVFVVGASPPILGTLTPATGAITTIGAALSYNLQCT